MLAQDLFSGIGRIWLTDPVEKENLGIRNTTRG